MNSIELDESHQNIFNIYDYNATVEILYDAMQAVAKWLEPFLAALSNWFASLPLSVQQYFIHFPSREFLIAILDDGET